MFPIKIIGEEPAPTSEILVRSEREKTDVNWRIPEETPVAFVYNRRNYAVMLATPRDIADFVIGFSLTEEIIDKPADILGLDIAYTDRGVDLRIKIAEELLARFDIRERRRTLPGNAGCGLCGLENADVLFSPLPKVSQIRKLLAQSSIERAIGDLARHQPINEATRSVHGAAWVSLNGEIQMMREDVGRHNALDKLLGAMALSGIDPNSGFVLMTSRCSYELVEKAARRGVQAMVTLSGPTAFAIRKAREANMALYAGSSAGAVELQF